MICSQEYHHKYLLCGCDYSHGYLYQHLNLTYNSHTTLSKNGILVNAFSQTEENEGLRNNDGKIKYCTLRDICNTNISLLRSFVITIESKTQI